MRLSTIRYIVRVAETGSFTKAAAQLYVSQPALSQSIQRFEQEIGMAVFTREKGQLGLTEAGQIVLEEGRRMLESEQRAYKRLEGLRGAKPRLIRIGSASTYQRFFLTETLTRLQSQYPEIHLHIIDGFSHNMCRMVEQGELEFALAFEPFGEKVTAAPIIQEEVFLAVPPGSPLLQQLSATPDAGSEYPVADLSLCRDAPFIFYPDDRRIQRVLMRETERAGFTPRGVITGYSTEAANAMAYQGLGLAFVPAIATLLCPPALRPVYFRLRPGGYCRTLALVSLATDDLQDIGQSLEALLKEQAAKRGLGIGKR